VISPQAIQPRGLVGAGKVGARRFGQIPERNRVPTPQAFEFYHALKDNHVDTRFVAAPRYGHFPTDPVGQEQVLRAWGGWIQQWSK